MAVYQEEKYLSQHYLEFIILSRIVREKFSVY